ncbi:MAG: RcnB family protein [Ramlibacter sp.]|nr:RcnB family protein [Ramlibacter sp.]
MRFFKLTLASAGAVALAMSAVTLGGVAPASAQPPGKHADCPPGLAKKGCMPPGQAKKYAVGRPLPADYGCLNDWDRYDLGRPRDGFCYSRVDNDIVLIAQATRNVIELVKIIDILTH